MKQPDIKTTDASVVSSSGLLLALPFVLIFVIAQLVEYKRRASRVSHTHMVMTAISDLLSVMQDMETGQRAIFSQETSSI